MRLAVQLPSLSEGSVSLAVDIADMRRLWLMILAMAVRDEANVVRWQPWEGGHILSYTVGAAQYGLVEPGDEFGAVAFEAAQQLISPGLCGRVARLLLRAGTGTLECHSEWGPSTWCGLWWLQGGKSGVEFVRLDRFPVPPAPHSTE